VKDQLTMDDTTAVENSVGDTKQPGTWAILKEDVRCVFQRDPAARTTFEVVTTYPGVHAIILYRLANRLWHRGWRYFPRFLSYLARIWTSIDIHPGATIGRRFFIDHGTGVVIGETAEVGDDVTLYHGVTLGGTSWSQGKRHPTLKDNVVVGAGAKILGPVIVGNSCKVGANSVVIKDVPDDRTVVGIPAKVVQVDKVASLNPYGVDLNHHLIPDPVATAMNCLLDRIRVLEEALGAQVTQEVASPEDDCDTCNGNDVCEPPVRNSVG
jgi:serine O-acetyltransferase